MAINNAGKGGNGRIDWQQDGPRYVVSLSAPVTRQSWRLIGDTHSEAGRLEGLEGGPREGEDAEALLLEATGWDIPVNALAHWVRGLRRRVCPAKTGLFRGGPPAAVEQAGWRIEYPNGSTRQVAATELPRRIEARRGPGHGAADRGPLGFPRNERVPRGDGWSTWPAPAKLNLFLHITGRRQDGYHQLQTVFRLLDWGDTSDCGSRDDGRSSATASRSKAWQRQTIWRSGRPDCCNRKQKSAKAPTSPSKSAFPPAAVSAADLPMRHRAGGLEPAMGAGLGIGPAGALGLQLGADVPVFVRGENAWAEGVGERLTPIRLPPAWYVLADPESTCPPRTCSKPLI